MPYHHPCRRGFASGQVKLLIAGVLALVGVALAVRGLMPTRSERTDTPKPSVVTADGTSPTPVRRERRDVNPADFGWTEAPEGTTYEFARVRNASDARNLADAIGRAVDTSADASNGLGGDLVGLLVPSIAGKGSVRDAVVALGGEDHDSIPVLDAIMQTVLRHASAHPAGIVVSKPDKAPAAIGGMSVNRNRTTDVDEDGNEIERDVISMMSSFERTFPDALAEDATGSLRTVEIPMRSRDAEGDGPDMRLSLTLRYNAAADAWQPALMKIDSNDADLMRRVMDAVRNAAPETETEGGN